MAAHYFILVLCGISLSQNPDVRQNNGTLDVGVGDNVTLRCFYHSSVVMHFSWYRQAWGGSPQLLSTIYKYDRSTKLHRVKTMSRFAVQVEEGINHLHITEVQCSDSAIYYCGSAHSNVVEFGVGVFLRVRDLKKAVLGPESLQPGASDREQGAYKCMYDIHSGMIRMSEIGPEGVLATGSPVKNCVYRWQKTSVGTFSAEAHFCMVGLCGERLGVVNGTEDLIAQMRILVFLSIIRSGILLLFVAICTAVYIAKSCSMC